MPDAEVSRLPTEPAGWLLRAPREPVDLDAMLARFGEVYRYPVAPGDEAAAMAPGQPCFLVRTDRSKVVGLWAIGSVVAPVLVRGSGADQRWEAEVELLPIERPIPLATLRTHGVLATSALVEDDPGPSLHPLRAAEVRALESFDFWLVEPSDEQRRALDRLLDDEPVEGSGP